MRSRFLPVAAAAALATLAAGTTPAQATARTGGPPTGSTAVAAPSPSTAPSPAPSTASKLDPKSFAVVRPSARPVPLRSAPRSLSVTYTFQGKKYTLDDYLARSKANGFVVLDGQKIVYERYRAAGPNTRFQSWSMAKSFTSAAVGIALHEGRIRSIDDPVTRYLPELRSSGYDGVSIRNLLRMSSGIDWDEKSDVPKTQLAAHRGFPVERLARRQVRGWEPGSRFEYTSMNSFVLARLVSEVTGMPYHRYVEEKIWKPAGMASTARIGGDSHDDLGYCCYYATDRDYARFGLLYLDKGRAGGRQVVPRAWVEESTRPSASFNADYGLHWWLGGGGDFMAAGFGGQYIYVSPEHRVVIVKSAVSSSQDREEALSAFRAVAAEVARTR
ncbi:serine hydrolase [Microbispora sp. H11081]|uniref:serine hydrolase domain-containing protein n=1 Tax=Microbispora sp. H11081 TaxID=2729107 RepID=UPI001474826F|nr:serine hydrolase [Microbispora sp. H11081]